MDEEGLISRSSVRMSSFHISRTIWGYQEDVIRLVAPKGPDIVLPGALKVVPTVMEGVTRGSTMVLPRGQTHGRRSPQISFIYFYYLDALNYF